MTWNDKFIELFDRCLAKYKAGNKDFTTYYTPVDQAFLESIGYQPREFFDFIEDLGDGGSPSRSTAILVAAVRRDYFLVVQEGKPSDHSIKKSDLPTFGDELGGMVYLPRILKKARAKLKGELDPDMMYGCGGDRNFLKKHGDIHMSDFLRNVWACGDDDSKVVEFIKTQMS